MKKITSLLLLVCMLFTMAACKTGGDSSQGETPSEDAQTQQTQVSEKGQFPIVSEPVELTVVLAKNAGISDYEDNDFYNWLTEQTGIKLKINAIPSDDITQKINLMLSSGQEMPDIFLNCLPMDAVSNYADKDIFVDLNEYIDTQGDYLGEFFAEHPEYRATTQLPDGRTLALPPIYPAGTNTLIAKHGDIGGKLWINKTWLDNLGLDEPTTTEELFDVLKAFKEKDPNGNGEADEIPLIGANKGGWDSLPEIFLSNAFLPYDLDQPYYRDENGTVQASYVGDAYREALQYINRLVSEGLLDPVTYTQDNSQLKQLVEMETPVVGAFASAASSMALTPGTDRFKEYIALTPVKGPDGVQLAKSRLWSAESNNFTAITTACKNPEAAFKLLDFWHTEEVVIRSKWGVENEHWKQPEEGVFANNGEQAKVEILENLYGQDPTNARSGINFGDSGRLQNYVVRSEDPYDPERFYYEESQKYFPHAPKLENAVINYFYTPEDAKAISEIKGTLTTYVDEARTKFILGTLDPNDDSAWDNYLSEIEKIGYKTILEIMQARHDMD